MAKPSKLVAAANPKAAASTKRARKAKSPPANKRTPRNAVAPAANSPARPETKIDRIIALLSRAQGVAIGDLVEATGWQAHSVRGAISGNLKKKLGLIVTSERVEARGLVYRISNNG